MFIHRVLERADMREQALRMHVVRVAFACVRACAYVCVCMCVCVCVCVCSPRLGSEQFSVSVRLRAKKSASFHCVTITQKRAGL